jgi:flagellar hook-associated protein 1
LDSVSGSAISDNMNSYNTQRVTEFSLILQKADTLNSQHTNLLSALVQDRESVNGVSLDEEAADLIKFQQAYNAAIRMMTAVDEMLDRVINNMGTVGR